MFRNLARNHEWKKWLRGSFCVRRCGGRATNRCLVRFANCLSRRISFVVDARVASSWLCEYCLLVARVEPMYLGCSICGVIYICKPECLYAYYFFDPGALIYCSLLVSKTTISLISWINAGCFGWEKLASCINARCFKCTIFHWNWNFFRMLFTRMQFKVRHH